MTKILLVQPNFSQGPVELNAYYLPYSIGVVWAYALQSDRVKSNYEVVDILWKRVHIDEIYMKYESVDVVAFSTYVWNKNWNYTLAQKIKSINPKCKMIFGGPEIPIESTTIFDDYPFMDYVVKLEGEHVFKELLEDFSNAENIPGLLINKSGKLVDTGNAVRINDLNDIPSPYLSGVFDKIVEDNPEVEWNSTLETNRGCPYACTFCDWGSLTYSKVKVFDLDRVFAELEWMAKHKCGYVSVTDANFGIFLDRDNMIADKLLEMQETYGYPYTFSVTWAKNQKDGVIDIVRKLTQSSGFNQGLTVSVQSMNLSVLENIKRKNLDQHKIGEIFKICQERNIPTYTELILGLPGETLESWKNNFWELFDAGAHHGLNIFQAQLLENAEMNVAQVNEYDMTSVVVYDYMAGSYDNDIPEGVKAVTSTNTLPYDSMIEAQVFSWYLNTFHVNGLTSYISRFFNKHTDVKYKEFYNGLWEYLSKDEWFDKQINDIKYYYDRWMTQGSIGHPKIGGVEIHGWNLIHKTILTMIDENLVDYVFDKIYEYAKTLLDNHELVNEIITVQRNIFIDYADITNYPKTIEFNYNFLGDELNQKTSITFEFNEDKNMSKEMFLQNIYFKRRRNFGKATVKVSVL